MIAFVGCSYTWGSGLQYEYLYEKGWSVDELNKVLPYNHHLELLEYGADEYRKQNNWPNLVAKELDKSYVIPTYCNGGSNLSTTLPALQNLDRISRADSITTIVVQFSDWLRDCGDRELIKFGQIDKIDKGLRLCDTIEGLDDQHLNSEGCKVVADSIIKKLKQYEN